MKKSMLIRGLAALAVCALVLPAIGSLENPVERPLKVVGHVVLIVDLATGNFVSDGSVGSNWGVASHIGLFANEAAGNLATGSSGTLTAANGDQIAWVATGAASIGAVSGTGRFEGVSGGFTFEMSDVVQELPGDGTMILSYTYTGTGTLTY